MKITTDDRIEIYDSKGNLRIAIENYGNGMSGMEIFGGTMKEGGAAEIISPRIGITAEPTMAAKINDPLVGMVEKIIGLENRVSALEKSSQYDVKEVSKKLGEAIAECASAIRRSS